MCNIRKMTTKNIHKFMNMCENYTFYEIYVGTFLVLHQK